MEVNETLQECAIRETREETCHNCHIISNNVIDEKDTEVTVWRNYQYVETMLNYSNLKELWDKAMREMTLIFNRNVNEDELER